MFSSLYFGSYVRYQPTDGNPGFHYDNGNGDIALDAKEHLVDRANRIVGFPAGVNLPAITSTDNDLAGNLINDSTYNYVYDAWNRLVEVSDSGGTLIARYSYDALGRRANKQVYNSGSLNTYSTGDKYYYDGDRIVEFHKTIRETHTSCSGGGGGGGTNKTIESTAKDWNDSSEQSATASTEISGSKDATRAVVGGGGTNCTTTTHYHVRLKRQFVYGFDYIDEQVAQFTSNSTSTAMYVLQDVNYNVVALASSTGSLIRQYGYRPYGALDSAEYGSGNTVPYDTSPTSLYTWQLQKGLWYDYETGQYQNRGRHYSPTLGRFLQRDPNGQALMLSSAHSMNAQTQYAFARFTAAAQYADSMNLYGFVGNNPNTGLDPSGLFQEDVDEFIYELRGHRVAALGYIQTGAGFVLMGMQGTLEIAGSILGIDLILAGASIIQGDAELVDYITLATTIASPAIAYGAFKAYKWARKFFAASARAERKALKVLRLYPGIPKPRVSNFDSGLVNAVEAAYTGVSRTSRGVQIGAGSTADAIRYTKMTGKVVHGKHHVMKGEQLVTRFERFLRRSPGAPDTDKLAAKAIIDDLMDALGLDN